MFNVVAPYVTGGVTNISEGHTASIFSFDELGGRDPVEQTASKLK
jgi:hypothetical protein